MGTYIHYFESETEFNQARNNNYTEPWLSYTEGKGVEYNKPAPQYDFNGYEYVDLGLPSGTLWATKNLGATNVSDYGDKYMWGATIPGNVQQTLPSTEGYPSLALEYDVAHLVMGGDWHIPTPSQLSEIEDNTTVQSMTLNGKIVAMVTSKNNGNVIYFPTLDYWGNQVVNHYDGDEEIEVLEVSSDKLHTWHSDWWQSDLCYVRGVIG